VIVAHMTDQFLWGLVLYRLGVAPKHLTRKALTAKGLAGAITQALSRPAMQSAAAAVGEKMRAEDGVGAAVKHIEAANC
jgi:UDP:flavonoid glycosyltransferase YjiC (YdhE family)